MTRKTRISIHLATLCLAAQLAQAQQPFAPPRLASGHPDMQGVWRSGTISAAFNVEAHAESYLSPAGPSVIVDPPDGKLPYLSTMRRKAQLNWEQRELDPVGNCHMHGIPRSMVPPFPLEIVQDGDYFALLHETEHSVRIIPTDGRPHRKNYNAWAGDSRGHWEGDTLVVDVTGLNGKTWLDQGGNFVGPTEHVVERFTMTGPNTIVYEARVTDPSVYTQPWTLRIPLQRQPKGTEIIEYDCIEGERDAVHYKNIQSGRSKQKQAK